ncbi:uncharacterized protein METZ01_LOCUS153594, partial [marine metagenome]
SEVTIAMTVSTVAMTAWDKAGFLSAAWDRMPGRQSTRRGSPQWILKAPRRERSR